MFKSVFSFGLVCVLIGSLATVGYGGTEIRSEVIHGAASRRFTLEQAVETALQRNPDIQRARQEIERTKGIYIEMRSHILPRVDALGELTNTDPHLGAVGSGSGGGLSAVPTQYSIDIRATQVIFAGGRIVSQIRSADFQRDSAYYGFRNAIDAVIASVRTQFYQVLLNRALIGVQEQSIQLLESQLRDQQNRFEAGTVPRFNVLQASVALANQQPELITARNAYRISQIQLAKTIGLDFDPNRGDQAPIDAVGELHYVPRDIPLTMAIQIAKEHRPFLHQQKANVLSNSAQVGVARSGYFPQLSGTASEEFRSNPFSENIRDMRNGYVFGATGSWAIWDWGETYGRVKQAKAVLQESKITLDDAVRQIELEVQQAYANMQQGRELIRSQEQTVSQADEALRLATARLQAGAGTQLEVLNARVEVTRAQSTSLQALYTYNAAVAEFDRATATEATYSTELDEPGTRAKLKTEAAPTPPPKPTPLPLNGHRGQTVRTTTTTTTTSSGK
ncbi:MAG: TolC family protein [Chthoniobacterales bacterium]